MKTDSAILRVGTSPQYLPWLKVRAVKSPRAMVCEQPGVHVEDG